MTLFLAFMVGGTLGFVAAALCASAGKEAPTQYTTGPDAKWSGWGGK